MATHRVTEHNWNDPSFWSALSFWTGDTLDLRALDGRVRVSMTDRPAGQDTVLVLQGDGMTFRVGRPGTAGCDATLSAGGFPAAGDLLPGSGAAQAPGGMVAGLRPDPRSDVEVGSALFCAGTLIRTEAGDRPVEALDAGVSVLTRDSGFQSVRRVGHIRLSDDDLWAVPDLRPIRIAPGALGARQPGRPLLLAPRHRVLLHGLGCDLYHRAKDALVAAAHLLEWNDVELVDGGPVHYVDLQLDTPELVLASGAWVESGRLGQSLRATMRAQADDAAVSRGMSDPSAPAHAAEGKAWRAVPIRDGQGPGRGADSVPPDAP